MNGFMKNAISCAWSLLRFCLRKVCRPGSISFHLVERITPNVEINIGRGGKLVLGNRVRVHRNTKISVSGGARLSIGDNTAVNRSCGFYAMEEISIGEGSEFGPGVLIYDHDHQFRGGGLKHDRFLTSPVSIGNRVWIGANCIILRGTVIGDGCVIGAGTVVKGNIPENSLVYQERNLVIRSLTS